jgi:hypothetical protein
MTFKRLGVSPLLRRRPMAGGLRPPLAMDSQGFMMAGISGAPLTGFLPNK